MREFWAVVGKLLVDEAFYETLFPLCGFRRSFEDLDGLRQYLLKELELGFGRWEVMKLNTIATERVQGNSLVEVLSPSQESAIAGVRAGWVGPAPSLGDQFNLCSVIGLAGMDLTFRTALHDASRKDPADIVALRTLLETPAGDTPIFRLPDSDLIILNGFMRSLFDGEVAALEIFHRTNWVQPYEKPCDGGATKTVVIEMVGGVKKEVTKKYDYFSQNGLNLLLMEQSPDTKNDWREKRAIL